MGTTSVAYVLCRIEDDASLTPVSQHEDFITGIAAAGHAVEVEDPDFAYALYAGDPSNGSSTTRVASFREGRIGYREWAMKTGRSAPASRIVTTTTLTSSWHEIVAATRWGSYEERTCSRCFEGRLYDPQRGAWVACERCLDSGRVMVYLYPKLKRRPR